MHLICERNRRIPPGAIGSFLSLLVGVLFVCANAHAWENTCTHPKITDGAISMLTPSAGNNNFFIELNQYQSQMDSGVFEEDKDQYGLPFAVINHFYQPKTTFPLYDAADSDNQEMSAISMFAISQPQTTALNRGDYWWYRAISEYKQGSKANAYTDLGHALHLLSQDMTQPAHTQNDPHIPQVSWAAWLQPHLSNHVYNGSDHSPLEASAETLCTTTPAFPAGTGVPSNIPVTHDGKPELDIAEAAARQSYSAATFTGDSDIASPVLMSGAIRHVFIGGLQVTVKAAIATFGEPLSDCAGNRHYEITPVNQNDPLAPLALSFLCYDPDFTYAGTLAQNFTNDWWDINNVGPAYNVWDPNLAQLNQHEFYTHYYNQVSFGGTQTLNSKLLYSQLISAENYTAALLQLFARSVDSTPPVVTVNNVDANGPVVPSQGYGRDSIFVTATDTGANPSGIGFLAVEAIAANRVVASGANVLATPSSGGLPTTVTQLFRGLSPDGLYQVHAVDGLGNHSYSTFTVTTQIPGLAVQSAVAGFLSNYDVTDDNSITLTATPAVAPFKSFVVTRDGAPYAPPFPVASPSYFYQFDATDPGHWYWVQACDAALNCNLAVFGLAPAGKVPPMPPPGPPSCPGCHVPTPPTLPVPFPPQPGPTNPACKANGFATCFPGNGGSSLAGSPIGFIIPGDPNSLQGPQGPVTPGQAMNYTVEFENVGDGIALGVFVKDVLDPALDDTNLTVSNMYGLAFSSGVPISTTTANFPWSYDPQTRTLTVLTGDSAANNGGSFTLQAKLKSTAMPGTVVNNQALVYFPNAIQQITPTNTVISAVPIQTTLINVGVSSAVYLSTAGLSAMLTAGANPAAQQLVNFQLVGVSTTDQTNNLGVAATDVFLSTAAGTYNLGMNYSGDNFYYLPTSANVNFTVIPRVPLLQAPFVSARATDTVHLALTLTDDRGLPFVYQTGKTAYLELIGSSGTMTPLASSLLSGSSVYFTFTMPQPLQLSWPIRARFAGDSSYTSVISSGVLSLIDDVPPTIAIQSPHGGEIFRGSGQISVNFSVSDNADLAPSATAYLVAMDGSQVIPFSNPGTVSASSLSQGSWTVVANAIDWAGNLSTAATPSFVVTSDVLPPQTTLAAGSPSFGSRPIYVSSQAYLSLSATDDRTTVGDGLGIGVAQTQYSIDGGSWTVYSSPFVLVGEGQHRVSFFSTDLAGNAESPQTTLLYLDSTPPVTRLAIDGVAASSSSVVLISTDAISFSPSDAGSGVAQTLYSLDGSTTQSVAVSTFSLAVGTHTIFFQSVDHVGNVEALSTAFALVRSSDTTPPSLTLIPATGSTLTTTTPAFAAVYIDTGIGVNTSSVRLALDGVDVTTRALITLSSASFTSSASLSQGTHTFTTSVADFAGNVAASTSTFLVDSIPPVTALLVDGLTASTTNLILKSSDTLGFMAADAGTGVSQTLYDLDGSTSQVYVSTFSLAVGTHTLAYHSLDLAGNIEVSKTAALIVRPLDVLAPRTSLVIGAPWFGTGPAYISTATPLTFQAVDDLLTVGDGVGIGVARTFYAVDSATFTVYGGTFTLVNPGTHTIQFYSVDMAGNVEIARSSAVAVDAAAPVASLQVLGPSFTDAGGDLIVSTVTALGFSTVDPAVNGFASGVRLTQYQINGGSFTVFSGTFTLAAPDGARLIGYQATDNVGNMSLLKNTTAFLDATPPVTSLQIAGGRQFAGPGVATFYASSDTRLLLVSTDPIVDGVASGVAFTRWQDNGVAFQLYASSVILPEGAHAFAYQSQDNVQNLEVLRSTMVLIDATPPITAVSIGSPTFTASDGTTYVATTTLVTFAATDPALASSTVAGSGVNHIEVSVDSAAFALYTSALAFAEGRHTILYRAVDNVGNVEAAHALSLRSDGTPPVTVLVIGAPQFQLSSATVLVSSLTPIGFTAIDPSANAVASGLQATFFQVSDVAPSTAPFAVYAASFTLTPVDVTKVIQFFSRDNVLNTEAVRSSSVLMDSTPPEAAILSPHGSSGICSVLKGKFPVLGTARDLHFASFALDAAPGQNASAGFVRVSSGAVAVSSGVLGSWDTTALAGWQTLRLTATDLVQNVTVAAINVYVGDPGELLVLGNHDVFDMPQGVAADAAGNIYVADTNADRIAVFTTTGAPVASFGQPHGDHDDGISTSTLRLNKPKSAVVDAAGNIFIADTNNDRVLKLSAAGQLLLTVGRRDKNGAFQPGKALGDFNKPSGVAVDAAGNIYVADTNNNRVQILNSTGTPLLAFDMPPVATNAHSEEGDHDDDRENLGLPAALAVDAGGNIYVADPRGGRALKFGATGQLLLTLPISGQTKDGHTVPGWPDGVAVSPAGDCLLVSDRKFSRVFKFDALGNQTLVFGSQGKIQDGKPLPPGIVFNKPAGLAFAPDGTLLVADRNNDRVERFGLPTGAPALVTPASHDDSNVAKDVLDKNDGGAVTRGDNAGVSVPPGALTADLKITVSTMSAASLAAADLMNQVSGGKGLKPAYAPVEYGPEGTKFNVPVTIVVPYDPLMVAAAGLSEDALKINYWNRDKSDWEALDSTVDKAARTVTAKTPHFSLYQVLGSTGAGVIVPLAAADPTFTLHDAYAFPNPVRGTRLATIRIQVGVADSIEVHIYDVTGRRVHASSDFRQSIIDDGNGKGLQFTDDHVWDISGIGSGVYTYVITAKKSGMADIHKAGRVGVVK